MKCIVCHGDQIIEQGVKEEVARGDDIVLVPVRTLVCQDCGERYYDRKTMRFLEKVSHELVEGRGPVRQLGKVLLYG